MPDQMPDHELKAIIAAEMRSALGYVGSSELSEDRERALDYYLGRPYGNEIDGRSKVVTREVADTVEWILPSLLRIFTSTDESVKFEPTGPEDEAEAKQATDYANYVMNTVNPGFLILYTWFKDALLQKNGVVKLWWEQKDSFRTETYEGLTDAEFALLTDDDEIEIVEHTERQEGAYAGKPESFGVVPGGVEPFDVPDIAAGAEGYLPIQTMIGGAPAAVSAETRGPMMAPSAPPAAGATMHDVKLRRSRKYGCIKIEPVPPEEFLIAKRAKRLDEGFFVAHRVRRVVSDLIAEGYDEDVVKRLPSWSESEALNQPERLARWEDEIPDDADGIDPSMREVSVTECYLRVDYDGDGLAELRKITIGGDADGEILDNEETDEVPFASITPVIQPHRFFGLSVADLVLDLQLIKSTILRQMLDGLYLANNPRTEAVESQVNLDDLLTNRPGGIVRVKAPGMLREMQTPWVGAQAFPMLEYLDGERESRTGVSRAFMGLDANALNNNTATAYTQMTSAAQSRVELIARIFAETGVKRLFQIIQRLASQHESEQKLIRLRNQWVPVHPREWSSEMDTSITVGLGTGNKDQQLGHLSTILGVQKEALQAGGLGLVTPKHVYNTLSRMIENAGLKSVEPYFSDPSQQQSQPEEPPQPSPDAVLQAQTFGQVEQMKVQQRAQESAEKLQVDREKMMADIQLAREKMAGDLAIAREELNGKLALQREEMMMRAEMERHKAMAQPQMMGAPS